MIFLMLLLLLLNISINNCIFSIIILPFCLPSYCLGIIHVYPLLRINCSSQIKLKQGKSKIVKVALVPNFWIIGHLKIRRINKTHKHVEAPIPDF